jgi:hypothetical protein
MPDVAGTCGALVIDGVDHAAPLGSQVRSHPCGQPATHLGDTAREPASFLLCDEHARLWSRPVRELGA